MLFFYLAKCGCCAMLFTKDWGKKSNSITNMCTVNMWQIIFSPFTWNSKDYSAR